MDALTTIFIWVTQVSILSVAVFAMRIAAAARRERKELAAALTPAITAIEVRVATIQITLEAKLDTNLAAITTIARESTAMHADIKIINTSINGRMDQLLLAASGLARAQGVVEGKQGTV